MSTLQVDRLHDLCEVALADAIDRTALNVLEFGNLFPEKTTVDNRYHLRRWEGYPDGCNVGWTNAFWTGMLWLAYEASGEKTFRQTAEAHIAGYKRRLVERIYIDHHDMGFLYTPSCVTAWRLTGNAEAREVAIQAANWLMTRYLPAARIVQSWGDLNDPAQRGRVIVDSLLNLPLLHWATIETGNPNYAAAALEHACRARDHLIRPDGSTYHTFHFDVATGAPLHGSTAQGWKDDSCWARGQAWAIYGFALNHRYHGTEGLLDAAMTTADYFLRHLPNDRVAYWDLSFSDGSDEPRDSSASAIAVCGLLEIADQLPQSERRQHYLDAAHRMLESLINNYMPKDESSNALLLHGVYSKPHGQGIDEASLWGDYYLFEALMRLTRIPRVYW
ncbi:glycoside hydrolase family 88 protein [Burkholderia pseudomallei]|uniref:Glycosyl Hydrolase Family 88 family protein n=1 Tax=Burkholderia pseudomallei TaxID=28450 RepID=A0AA40JI80_BURPE|nr:glycoside hydrolase family 88 protein [Burkholderia pseudomallei]KGS74171.1 glycosyl Hydrolase Family 88 family protein [Burkholderia pseudomallei MSHR5596]KGW80304.1 glycosyl Hydrolase Family 88 family protein [Burkholderia pseudomallei MSHR2990]KGX17245.1 glycosyl Hydrolase Family 88 family protein [Burkholderia pseudomallei]